ncbi:MAG TPA: DUF4390 domain-containing protein [Methylibium sp.]|nr:DUF4390 domain-containing protein [Methylibium sp.]
MLPTARVRSWLQPLAVLRGLAAVLLATLLAAAPVRAETIELTGLDLARTEDGLLLDYAARFELPRAVEDALQKGVPVYFVARAEVFRSRWYWRDARVGRATRNWRLTWQPLTRRYRLNLGSISQNHDTLAEALGAIQRASRWKLADAAALGDDTGLYVELSLRLDTGQLPRPLQIGFGGQADWDLAIERTLAVPDALTAR